MSSAPLATNMCSKRRGAGELIKGRPGGQRQYAHGVERIDPAPNSPTLNLDFHLKRGSTLRGELVDAQGTPIEEAVIISRLNVDARMLDCNAAPVKVTGGRFEISSLAPNWNIQSIFWMPSGT